MEAACNVGAVLRNPIFFHLFRFSFLLSFFLSFFFDLKMPLNRGVEPRPRGRGARTRKSTSKGD